MRSKKIISSVLTLFCLVATGCMDAANGGGAPSQPQDTYTVTFDSKGGSPVAPQTVEKGGYVTKPNNPSRDGYEFVKWVDEYETAWIFDVNTVTRNITLSAVWYEPSDGNKKVELWTSYGSAFSSIFQPIAEAVATETQVEIDVESQGSYDEMHRNMISSIAVGDYPNVGTNVADYIYSYLGSNILTPLEDYFTSGELNDYYDQYLHEYKFYDNGRSNVQQRQFALPFAKSTDILAYNGTFVDYCKTINPALGNIPATWDEWDIKGPLYYEIYATMFGKRLYGVQDVYGHASSFELLNANEPVPSGKNLLIDLKEVDPSNSYLMSLDEADSAFITLLKQWGAQYTEVAQSEHQKIAKKRVGSVMFNSAENQPKVVDMLKFFNKLHHDHLIATPAELNGTYSSDAYEEGRIMFMICSSTSLLYTSRDWSHRFSVAPIPYKEADKKFVIQQGSGLFMTDRGNFENCAKVLKALTTGKHQADWCLSTGYYPASKSAFNHEDYQAFLHEDETQPTVEAYSNPLRVAYRESAKLNCDHYMDSSENWIQFVTTPFNGSDALRSAIAGVLSSSFALSVDASDSEYASKLNQVENNSAIKYLASIYFVH